MTAGPDKAAVPGPAVTEAEMNDTLRDFCRLPGWKAAHFRPARDSHGRWHTAVQGDGVGWPDWFLAHPRAGMLWVELKTLKGRLSAAQEEWGEHLIRCGGVFRVVRGKAELDQFLQELADRAVRL